MMRFARSEKMEIIRLVQESQLGVKATLEELEVPRSSFYRWCRRYREEGYDRLANRPLWNTIICPGSWSTGSAGLCNIIIISACTSRWTTLFRPMYTMAGQKR